MMVGVADGNAPTSPAPAEPGRFDQLDGLRALAFLTVFGYHFGLPLRPILEWGGLGYRIVPNLDLGVEIFFVLSGFLIFRPFAAANLRDRARPAAHDYAIRRVLRIYPAYWVIFFALLALHEPGSALERALGADRKGKVSLACYIVALSLAFIVPWVSVGLFVAVALLWFIPDRRIERVIVQRP